MNQSNTAATQFKFEPRLGVDLEEFLLEWRLSKEAEKTQKARDSSFGFFAANCFVLAAVSLANTAFQQERFWPNVEKNFVNGFTSSLVTTLPLEISGHPDIIFHSRKNVISSMIPGIKCRGYNYFRLVLISYIIEYRDCNSKFVGTSPHFSVNYFPSDIEPLTKRERVFSGPMPPFDTKSKNFDESGIWTRAPKDCGLNTAS